MNATEKESILSLSLLAAFADGAQSDVERAELKRIAESLPDSELRPVDLFHRVLSGQTTVDSAATTLTSASSRQLAYEMAVCVCEADDALSAKEKEFLDRLRRELKLDAAVTAPIEAQVEQVVTEPLAAPPVLASAAAPAVAAATSANLDQMVLNYAILNGALELLPESLATMAIIPLQMKMVYRIGKAHGYELDRGHIKDLLATAGAGLTSQVVEGYARKLLGGLLGKVGGGGMMRSAGNQVVGSAMSFATTWALGRLAVQYYAGGRKLSAIEMRQVFGSLTEQARGLHASHAAAIRDKAGSLNLTQLLPLIRGQQ